jgi:hypothetical protein
MLMLFTKLPKAKSMFGVEKAQRQYETIPNFMIATPTNGCHPIFLP